MSLLELLITAKKMMALVVETSSSGCTFKTAVVKIAQTRHQTQKWTYENKLVATLGTFERYMAGGAVVSAPI